jgi:thymidylate synthase (FAD)
MVKVISYSKSDSQSMQDLVAYCARVSNPANQQNTETNEKLIRYLIKNHHWSPLEMVSICLEIETTRDIARQILRHRSFSFQEFSQRYAIADLGFSPREARVQDPKNRQNSTEVDNDELQQDWKQQQTRVIEASQQAYKWAIDHGIAKEQARAVLPEGNTMSRMYMNGTLRSWVHYIQLRSGNGTQKEHREVALACAHAIEPIFPMIKEFITTNL